MTVETIRFLDSNVAIADTHVVVGPPAHKIDLLGSYVMVKQGSAWFIGAARIARTRLHEYSRSVTSLVNDDVLA